MKYLPILLLLLSLSCKDNKEIKRGPITTVESQVIFQDSTSIRALEVMEEDLVFAGSNGIYGHFTFSKSKGVMAPRIAQKNIGSIDFLDNKPAFRSIATTSTHVYLLSIAQPALLYKYDKETHSTDLVYIEDVEGVFYDSLDFWNDKEGIAMGDPVNGCLSIIITRDGGTSWNKITCDHLPKSVMGEAAFAASDTNISIYENHTWIITGGVKSRVLYSPDKGNIWKIYETPLKQGKETTGGYSIDFYDENNGVIYGGDYLMPEQNEGNIAITSDGGKNWTLVGDNSNQGYKSCVQYIPKSNGKEMVAVGFTGISYSQDHGATWKELSKEPFLSFRFLNDSIAFASGSNKLSTLSFKRY